jgi:signal transduction histidine kinase
MAARYEVGVTMRISFAARPGGQQAVAAAASGSATSVPRGRPPRRRLLAELALVALSAPALMSALALSDLDNEAALRAAVLWSIVQTTLLVFVLRGHAPAAVVSSLSVAGKDEHGLTTELAEAAVRREEERLHELRATVSGIGMTHRLLHEHPAELPVPTRKRLEGLYESELSRLQRLVDEAGPEHSSVETLEVASLIDPMIESMRLRGVPVTWSGGSAWAAGRPDEVLQIVHNLLENAARHAEGAPVSVAVTTSDDEVRVEVSDSGPGIPTRLESRLFERGARRDGSPGHGLGLHIARRLAREMGGDLRLRPAGPRGAGFTLMLPASRDGAACMAPLH